MSEKPQIDMCLLNLNKEDVTVNGKILKGGTALLLQGAWTGIGFPEGSVLILITGSALQATGPALSWKKTICLGSVAAWKKTDSRVRRYYQSFDVTTRRPAKLRQVIWILLTPSRCWWGVCYGPHTR